MRTSKVKVTAFSGTQPIPCKIVLDCKTLEQVNRLNYPGMILIMPTTGISTSE